MTTIDTTRSTSWGFQGREAREAAATGSAAAMSSQIASYSARLASAAPEGKLAVVYAELAHIDRQLLKAFEQPRRERRQTRKVWKERQREVEQDLQVALLDHIQRSRTNRWANAAQ